MRGRAFPTSDLRGGRGPGMPGPYNFDSLRGPADVSERLEEVGAGHCPAREMTQTQARAN
jgi:hypothetical protein